MVDVLFFGATAQIHGKRRIELESANGPARDLFEELMSRYPALRSHKLLLAVNQQYSSGEQMIKDGDEVAIFTAVSGG